MDFKKIRLASTLLSHWIGCYCSFSLDNGVRWNQILILDPVLIALARPEPRMLKQHGQSLSCPCSIRVDRNTIPQKQREVLGH